MKPTRPIYTSPPTWEAFTPAPIEPPSKPSRPNVDDAILEAEHADALAEFYAERKVEREAAEAAWSVAKDEHDAVWSEALGKWEADVRSYRNALPGHPMAGAWLAANPIEGVECVDSGDGLGPRLEGWPDATPAPDFATFASDVERRNSERLNAYNADVEALRAMGTAVSRSLLRLLGESP